MYDVIEEASIRELRNQILQLFLGKTPSLAVAALCETTASVIEQHAIDKTLARDLFISKLIECLDN